VHGLVASSAGLVQKELTLPAESPVVQQAPLAAAASSAREDGRCISPAGRGGKWQGKRAGDGGKAARNKR